ncbi:MAG: NAD(P)-binding domain-containing protein [Leptospiraceae bacterium]|nr:NAD(P)-binding domain-containing protein [Leptospiraceae bacterium]
MRSLFLGDIRLLDVKEDASSPYKVYLGYSAYQLLLEITCGLKSRLLGETEVFNQFKEAFKNENLPYSAFGDYLKKLRDEIIEDTRKIRRNHLIGLGDQSYGSLARRFLGDSKKVTLLGTGQLAEQILPYLIDSGKDVTIVGRNQDRLRELKNKYIIETHILNDSIPVHQAMVVCAPIKISRKLQFFHKDCKIIDFRENNEGDSFPSSINYLSFFSILEILKENENKNKKLKSKLEIFVSKIVEEREYVSSNNIFCWEDIPCIASSK